MRKLSCFLIPCAANAPPPPAGAHPPPPTPPAPHPSGSYKQQIEEIHASSHGTFADDIKAELAKLDDCDLLMFVFPIRTCPPPLAQRHRPYLRRAKDTPTGRCARGKGADGL
jgi:hypothetical protein